MTLRGCPSLGTRSPVQASVPGELSAAVPQRRVLMRPTLAWDQWQRPGCRRHHRGVVRSPWDTRTRCDFYSVKEVVSVSVALSSRKNGKRRLPLRGTRGAGAGAGGAAATTRLLSPSGVLLSEAQVVFHST